MRHHAGDVGERLRGQEGAGGKEGDSERADQQGAGALWRRA